MHESVRLSPSYLVRRLRPRIPTSNWNLDQSALLHTFRSRSRRFPLLRLRATFRRLWFRSRAKCTSNSGAGGSAAPAPYPWSLFQANNWKQLDMYLLNNRPVDPLFTCEHVITQMNHFWRIVPCIPAVRNTRRRRFPHSWEWKTNGTRRAEPLARWRRWAGERAKPQDTPGPVFSKDNTPGSSESKFAWQMCSLFWDFNAFKRIIVGSFCRKSV